MVIRCWPALALIVSVCGPAVGEPPAPAGVDLATLLGAGSIPDLQADIDGLKGDDLSSRWVRARLYERQGEVLAAAGLLGAAGEAAAKGLRDCGPEAWEVAARLHLMLARFCDELGPDRRDAYDALRGRTADAEISAAEKVAQGLGDGFAAQLLALQIADERGYRTCRALAGANPDKLLGPVVEALRKLKAGAADKPPVAWALCKALNDCADACRRKATQLNDTERKTDQAAALLKAALRLFGEAWDAYAEAPNPTDAARATLLQNRALALINLGEILLYATPFDDPHLTDAQREAALKPVREAAPPQEAQRLLQEALRLSGMGRPGGQGQAPPATRLHWVLLQNLAQAITYEVLVTRPGDPTPSLVRARRLARRSADELEGLGLYLEALDAMSQEARALELGGQMIEAALVYLHGIELCRRTVAGLAPSEGGEYRRIKDAMFGRLTEVLQWLRQNREPFPEELLGEWGASWEEAELQVTDLAKAQTFADFAQMGAVWRESRTPLIASFERLRADTVRMEEKAAGGALDAAGRRRLAQMREQWLETSAALAAGADRGYSEAMALTRVGPAQIQSVLREGEVVVAYYLWNDVGTVTVLKKTGAPVVVDLRLGASDAQVARLLGPQGGRDLESVVAALVQATREGLWPESTGVMSPEGAVQPVLGKWPQALRLLYRLLVAPIAEQIADARTIIFIPHGALHYVPFEALIAGFAGDREPAETDVSVPVSTRFWGLEGRGRAVAYLPTAGSLYALRSRAARASAGVGVVARPRYPQHPEGDAYQQAVLRLAAIPRSVAAAIRAPGPFEGAAATPEAAQRVLEAPVSLAAFGCHGKANWRTPLSSCLMLAPSGGHDTDGATRDGEPLDLARTMVLPIAAPVVFLAACQTGQSVEVTGGRGCGSMGRPGDDLLSLSRGYLVAGARALVTSLWECDPAVTVDFWQEFSRAWMQEGRDVGEAVLAAKQSVLRRQAAANPKAPYATPTWWAGFEVHGDPACKYGGG